MADELICRVRKRLRSGFELSAELAVPLAESAVTVLFGPSGSGKTTLLRILAGLEDPDEGTIEFRGTAWFDSARRIALAPQKRRAGFLFQEYALFPHLTVAQNVGFAAAGGRAAEMMKSFDLADLAARYPREVSGGQQQRVALARALAAQPVLLLLDEPLSALDAPSRLRMRAGLRGMLVASRIPAIVVTHDRAEAIAIGDRMAVLVDGGVRQSGSVQEVLRHPADAVVAASVGVENVLPAEIAGREHGLLTLRIGAQHLQCIDGGESGPFVACIHAEDVALSRDAPEGSSVRNRVAGRVVSVVVEGPLARVELDCGFPLVSVITAQSAADLRIQPGDGVCAIVKATAVRSA
ncbi:MAG TPA: ABC transporter ATP-binding protein [Verrucomicrobiae bacterium]|nr:ABC transporter ATP-binding protein [Verrucomicrobiae bacterium]